jgi:uncharacterized protein YcbK (DUF882 family)
VGYPWDMGPAHTAWLVTAALLSSLAASTVSAPVAADAPVQHTRGSATKKGYRCEPAVALLGTLYQTHTGESVPLDDLVPNAERFDALLSDRVTGSRRALDPQLLGLLRALAARHAASRIELVSGFRSEKLNEMLRKKGHHVATHSQHTLGHAVDFRLVPAGDAEPMNPLALEREIREIGWQGGTGVYLGKDDRFVHADVGPDRRWNGQ